jgi:hypothetical protein
MSVYECIGVRSGVQIARSAVVPALLEPLDFMAFSDMRKADFVECIQKCHNFSRSNIDVSSVLLHSPHTSCVTFKKYVQNFCLL